MKDALINMPHRKGLYPYGDIVVALLVFATGFFLSQCHFSALNGEHVSVIGDPYVYGPAVMLAHGYGFYSPDLDASPELRAFLRGERESLPRDILPEVIPERRSEPAEYHRYLVYAMALFWWLFGVSWTSIELLLSVMFGWGLAAAYGLMRLGMGRVLSILAALSFGLSPGVLFVLGSPRDFSKTPFLLSIMFLLFWLLKTRTGWKPLAWTAALLGATTGVALGFRQDTLIFVPPAIITLGIAGWRLTGASWNRRLLPIAAYLACFALLGWPMFFRMEGGAQLEHPLVQGFSMTRLHKLGIRTPAYESLALGTDLYVFATLYDYNRRMRGDPEAHIAYNEPGADAAGRQWLMDTGWYFPADLLTRGYASALRALRHADAFTPDFGGPTSLHGTMYAAHRMLARHLHLFGPLYAALALLLIAGNSVISALALLVFGLYIFGYAGLQCELRHTFHLSFVVFWVLGFLLQRLLAMPWTLTRATTPLLISWKTSVYRAALFSSCALVLMVAPLAALRAIQTHSAATLLEPYFAPSLRLTPTTRQDRHGWASFSVSHSNSPKRDIKALYQLIAALAEPEARLWHTRTRYMMVELEQTEPIPWLIVDYESQLHQNDFSQLIALPRDKGIQRYFFPVHELLCGDEDAGIARVRGRFSGIALPASHADAFRGLYEITDTRPFTFLLHLALTEDGPAGAWHQRIHPRPDWLFQYHVEIQGHDNLHPAEAARRMGRIEDAVFHARSVLYLARAPSTRLAAATLLAQLGFLDAAFEGARDVRDPSGDLTESLSQLFHTLGSAYRDLGALEKAEKAYVESGRIQPARLPEMRLLAARTFVVAEENEKALDRFYTLAALHPDDEEGLHHVDAFLRDHYTPEERLAFWRDVLEETPQAPLIWLRVGRTLEETGAYDEAGPKYRRAYELLPDNPDIVVHYAAHHAVALGPDETAALIRGALDIAPRLTNEAAARLERSASQAAKSGLPEVAAHIYALAAEFMPDAGRLHLSRAEALLASGDHASARALLTQLLATDLAGNAAILFDQLFKDFYPPAKRRHGW